MIKYRHQYFVFLIDCLPHQSVIGYELVLNLTGTICTNAAMITHIRTSTHTQSNPYTKNLTSDSSPEIVDDTFRYFSLAGHVQLV